MKVNIKKYPIRLMCNIHTNYMYKNHGYINWPPEQSTFENSLEWLEDRIQNVYEIFNWMWFDRRKQKIKVRIDNWDTWNLDTTLATVIHPALVEFRKKLNAHPLELTDIEEWKEILDKMIFSFYAICNNDKLEDVFYTESEGWDFEGREEHYNKIQEGLDLFGKYFRGLWD